LSITAHTHRLNTITAITQHSWDTDNNKSTFVPAEGGFQRNRFTFYSKMAAEKLYQMTGSLQKFEQRK